MKTTLTVKRYFILFLAFVFTTLSCKKTEDEQPEPPEIITEYFIKGTLSGSPFEVTDDSPWAFELGEGLNHAFYFGGPDKHASISIGIGSYKEADILALKGRTLNFGNGRDEALFFYQNDQYMLNSLWANQPQNSYFTIDDVIPQGINASGFKKFALRGRFNCALSEGIPWEVTDMRNAEFTILVVETFQ